MRESTTTPASSAGKRGPTPETQVPTCLPKLLFESPVWFFGVFLLREEPLSSTYHVARQWAFFSFWGLLSFCSGGRGGEITADSLISSIYFSFSRAFWAFCLSLNGWKRLFHFHPLVFISSWQKGIVGTLFRARVFSPKLASKLRFSAISIIKKTHIHLDIQGTEKATPSCNPVKGQMDKTSKAEFSPSYLRMTLSPQN